MFRHLAVRLLIKQFLSLFLGETLLPIETGQEAGGPGSAPCPALDPVSQAREYRGGGTLPRHGLEQVCTWGEGEGRTRLRPLPRPGPC